MTYPIILSWEERMLGVLTIIVVGFVMSLIFKEIKNEKRT